MKLSCQRCKAKKVKCDKSEGTCSRCKSASAECIYLERRKRPRLTQQKENVRDLSRRLESLEKHLSNAEDVSSSASPPSSDARADVSRNSITTNNPTAVEESGSSSWFYQMAHNAKNSIDKVNKHCQTPIDTPMTNTVDTAITALNDALEDLRNLKIISDRGVPNRPALDLSPEEGKECIKSFLNMLEHTLLPDALSIFPELMVLNVMPDIVESPYVTVDPAAKVLYYNALYYGLYRTGGKGSAVFQQAYLKCLESVPAWLDVACGSILDCLGASLTAWTSINNFDYQLSWKFHCKSCQYIKLNGWDCVDTFPAKTHEEEQRREQCRHLFWHVLQTDTLFRIFYGKPSAIQASYKHVKPPAIFTVENMQPKLPRIILQIAWIRYTVMAADFFETYDKLAAQERLPYINNYCSRLDELLTEWEILEYMQSPRLKLIDSWIFADFAITVWTTIVGVRRMLPRNDTEPLDDPMAVRSSRMVIDTIIQFTRPGMVQSDENSKVFFFLFVTFYPFAAFFSLYEHILASPKPEQCEADLEALESIANIMKVSCSLQPDFMPIYNTINALNKVSRTIQESKRDGAFPATPRPTTATNTPPTNSQASTMGDQYQPAQQFEFHQLGADIFQGLASPLRATNGQMLEFPFPQDLQPLGLVRALENDFNSKNWHDNWWDMNGTMNSTFD
ncbi:hypothetical protein K469DRAFT_307028 [Zopfia rhizophila CBS 207.26]|uniref:Zn(2)-C6 fungal-type domain-containing protein n=1 Tax=Zopfia rhizophila CBS 207.26 TaxID=1314779 RepID=A0A6A6EJ96_9PEZI|nr:hypothetical protein K469DRAFT_307028 [Zopfia rhizophila CBS 207.26]